MSTFAGSALRSRLALLRGGCVLDLGPVGNRCGRARIFFGHPLELAKVRFKCLVGDFLHLAKPHDDLASEGGEAGAACTPFWADLDERFLEHRVHHVHRRPDLTIGEARRACSAGDRTELFYAFEYGRSAGADFSARRKIRAHAVRFLSAGLLLGCLPASAFAAPARDIRFRHLVAEADILVLDEPISALDLRNQSLVIDWIRRLSRSHGMTVIFTTHQPNHALAVADEALVMLGTTELAFGPAESVLDEAKLSRLYGVKLKQISVEHEGEKVVHLAALF